MRRRIWSLAATVTLMLAVACGTGRKVSSSDGSPAETDSQVDDDPVPPKKLGSMETLYFAAQEVSAVDLLFVIDNSGSMAQEQLTLINAFPRMMKALEQGMGELPDLRVGVISSDLGAGPYSSLPSCESTGGDFGSLQNQPRVAGCTPPSDPWISHAQGKTNIAEGSADPATRVAEAFGCIAKLGTGGCGFEQQLEAARTALHPENNNRFLRDGALLAVVFVTDEDDCSAKNQQLYDPTQTALSDPLGPITSFRCFEFGIVCDINDRNKVGARNNCVPGRDWLYDIKQRYVDFFASLKPADQLVMAAISGPTDRVEVGRQGGNPTLQPSCQSSAGLAMPAIRIKAVIDELGGQFSSICNGDYGPAMVNLGNQISQAGKRRCLGALADMSATPGLQAQCTVEQLSPSNVVLDTIPRCLAAGCDPCPCWRVVEDPKCIEGNALRLERAGVTPDGPVRATCAVP